jgi:hypothetical protein
LPVARRATRIKAHVTVGRQEPLNKTKPERLTQIKARARLPGQPVRHIVATEERTTMTTMTLPSSVARTQAERSHKVSQLMPLLLALVLLAATAVASVLISGPMH